MYIGVNSSIVMYHDGVAFDTYMRKGGQYFLFARGGTIGEVIRQRFVDNGVRVLYVRAQDKGAYDLHAETVFPEMLQDARLPLRERSRLLHAYSIEIGMDLFRPNGLLALDAEHRARVEKLMDGTYAYLSRARGAFEGISKLMYHNNTTYNHCVNVALYTISLLVRLGYSRTICRHAGAGATLHDIGKIKVPRKILDKPGRLTDAEREIINKHPDDGLIVSRAMELEAMSRDCVIFHHEKLDGSGYPGGVRSIPEHVRVVTVADIFDALTSDRPYSKCMTTFEAMKIVWMEAEAGKLDRDICKEFIKMLTQNGVSV